MGITRCYQKSSMVVSRRVADEVILVPIRQNVGDLQRIYTMNEIGARVWELLDGKGTVADMVSAIGSEYEVEPAQAEADVVGFLAQLESIGAVNSVRIEGRNLV